LIFRSGVLGPGDPPHILLSYDPVVDPGPTLIIKHFFPLTVYIQQLSTSVRIVQCARSYEE
jgi:hypothetical protein